MTLRLSTIILVTILVFCSATPCSTAEQKSPEPQKTAALPPASTAVPVAEVAKRATEVSNLLQILSAKLTPSHEIEKIRKLLPRISGDIDLELAETTNILREQPTLELLETQQQLWQRRQLQTTNWLNILTDRASKVQEALDRLDSLQKEWTMTRAAAQASKAPGPILQQIDATLAASESAQKPLEEQRAAVLDLQSRVALEVNRCGTALAEIAKVQQKTVGGIFAQDHPPIWSARLWAQGQTSLPTRVREVAAAYRADLDQYVSEPSARMLHAGLLLALTLLLYAGRRQIHRWEKAGEGTSSAMMIFDYPFSAALTVSLLVATSPASPLPATLKGVFSAFAFVPMILLTRRVVNPLIVPGLYSLGVLFAVDTVRQAFSGAPPAGQGLLVLEALLGIGVVWWLLIKLRGSHSEVMGPASMRLLWLVAFMVLLTLAAGLAAGAMGYVRLARLLTPGLLVAGALALASYTTIRVVNGMVAFSFRLWPLRALRMVAQHRDLLERRAYRLLIWAAILGFVARYLYYIGLLEPAQSLLRIIMATKFERGSISISLGDVIAFFLVVWVAFLLSAFIRFALEEDVYPRIKMAPGQTYATSSLIHYVILAVGFVVGIGVLGVNLTKITVLAGAFGVGIGFGLQSVVNNFVSGLILLFERPVHVGDTVELGDLLGKISRIGIRASTVRTWEGADIIVPNSQLVTEKVTNWTLSDQLRRIDLPVGVNYGAAPKEVIRVLETVARTHSRILQAPAPQGLFVGYGDSTINFELRSWTDQFNAWPQIRSELAVAVYDAVHAAGMTFPFPQREVRLLRNPETGTAAAPVNPVNKTEIEHS